MAEDKGKVQSFDKSELNGMKPFGNIGPDRSVAEMTKNVVSKLKKKKSTGEIAEGSTSESGEKANVVSSALSGFANRR